MVGMEADAFWSAPAWLRADGGPRYLQLARHISGAIAAGRLGPEAPLPPERDLASLAEVSRVTVRKAIGRLAADGLVEQRPGAGSFVRSGAGRSGERLEQSLSRLTSFTEYMRARGKDSTSAVLARGLFPVTPDESVALGLPPEARVARIERLRHADGVPMAIERSSLPVDILPDPGLVETSLYSVLREGGQAPVRAIQRIGAVATAAEEARMLGLADGSAVLRIDRTGYLSSGRPVEFTRGLYRSDLYDFVAELRVDP